MKKAVISCNQNYLLGNEEEGFPLSPLPLMMETENILERLKKMRLDIDRIINESRSDISILPPGYDIPDTEVRDGGDEMIATYYMPGIDKENIEIDLDEDWIEVRARRSLIEITGEESYIGSKESLGYYKMVELTEQIVPEEAKAYFEDNVLAIVAPKAKAKKAGIKIS